MEYGFPKEKIRQSIAYGFFDLTGCCSCESPRREKQWRDHNRVLLRKMFTASEFADQHDESVGAIRPVQDRYMDEFDQIRARLCSIRRQAACLSSIKNQLEQIDQDSGSDRGLARRPDDQPSGATIPG